MESLVVTAPPETQETLTQYLDIVETCLLKQISSRSQQFFEALTNLQVWISEGDPNCIAWFDAWAMYGVGCFVQEVRERVSQACRYVHRLRQGLEDIRQRAVLGAMRIPRLAQRKANSTKLMEKLKLMEEVQRSKEIVQSLLASEDYMAALDILEDSRAVLRDSLAGVQCLRKLDRQLSDYLDLVVDLMGGSFINVAVMAEGCR